VYELTDWGRELEPVIMALGRWGARSPVLLQGHPMSVDAFVLSLRTMFDPKAAAGFSATLELRLGDDCFRADIARGRMQLDRGRAPRPHAVIESRPDTLAQVVYGGRKLADALRTGDARVEGDKSAARRFLSLFPLPPTVEKTAGS